MGILSEPDGEQRELYSSRDRELLERREFYWSQAEHYPLLEDVIRGKTTLQDRASELLETTFPRVVRILQYSGFSKRPYALPTIPELFPFVNLLSALSETTRSVDCKQLLIDLVCGKGNLFATYTKERLKRFSLSVTCSAILLDKSVRRSFPDMLVQNPAAFKKEYRRMNTDDREYAEYTLSRMLGAGILEVDGIELERIIWEAKEQAESKKNDAKR